MGNSDTNNSVTRITFALPDGPTLGGVTTWTAEMCRRLSAAERPVSLVEHMTYNQKLPMHLPTAIQQIDCTDGQHADSPFIKQAEVQQFADRYQQALPAVIIPNWSIGTYAACAQLAADNPQALRVIGYAHTDEDLYYDWLAYYEAIIHQFVCVSDEIATKLIIRLPQRAADITIRPYAVNVSATLKRSYSAQSKPLKLIYAGRISQRQKQIFDLMPLIAQLEDREIDFQLRIVGNGDEYATLEKKIAQLNLATQQRVTLEPGLLPEQMAEAWRSADVFLSVSEYEGTSIAMLEAMAQGCVPVVTRVSGTNGVITDQENGFLININDMSRMAQMIEQLALDREQLARIGTAAHHTIASNYRYEEYIEWFTKMADELWGLPDRSWPKNRPIIPPNLGAIKRADITGSLQGDPAAFRILQHKLLHATKLAGPYYFMRDITQRMFSNSNSNRGIS